MTEPTDRVVAFARTAVPPQAALAAAADQLDRYRMAAQHPGKVAAALAAVAEEPKSPLWTAWITGAAAASDPELVWVAVCAAADAVGEDDADIIVAVAVGCEVAERVAEALGSTHVDAGWAAEATAGVIGAGAAAGRLLGLTEGQLRDAIGLCATQAAGLTGVHGTDAAALQLGKAAANAVEAALLGSCGYTSSARSLEGRRGMFAVMSTAADPSAVGDRLGAGWNGQ
jgi:2-methylcitrate dehydratase PrpD